MRVHRLVTHDVHVVDPKVAKPNCAQHLVTREVHRCVLWIAMCYENVACAAFGCKLGVNHVHLQRMVNRGPFLEHAPALKPCCG